MSTRHPTELERRFLVRDGTVTEGHVPERIVQAYLLAADGWAVRVRRISHPGKVGLPSREGQSTLAVKGPRHDGARIEYEWPIPSGIAIELIRRAELLIRKDRYQLVDPLGEAWDVDVFLDRNDGLIIAEYESETISAITVPVWCGDEVTADMRYDNENLARYPISAWPA